MSDNNVIVSIIDKSKFTNIRTFEDAIKELFDIASIEDQEKITYYYIFPSDYKETLDKYIHKSRVGYWKYKIKELFYNNSLTAHGKSVRDKLINNSIMTECLLKNKLVRNKNAFENESAYFVYLKPYIINNIDLIFDYAAEIADKNETEKILIENVINDMLNNAITDSVVLNKINNITPKTIVCVYELGCKYFEKKIDIPFGIIAMITLILWYVKFPKKMKWWRFLGLASDEECDSKQLLYNNEYLLTIFKDCNWYNDINDILYILKKHMDFKPYYTFNIINEDAESIRYFLTNDIDNKMDSINKIINTYLSNINNDLQLSSFSFIFENYKQNELNKRFDKVKLIRTQFI